MTDPKEALIDMLERWTQPTLVFYLYPDASCGPKGQGVEEVCIVHRCDSLWPSAAPAMAPSHAMQRS